MDYRYKGMNNLMNNYSFNYSVKWRVPKEQMLTTIINSIQMDHPVIISVASSGFSNHIEFGDYKDGKFSYINEYVIGHYMTVTGVYVDDIKNETYLKLSSWGSEYYIKFNDYIYSINDHQCSGASIINTMTELFNNILYI